MAKRLGSLKHQITQALIAQKRFGESKHAAKQASDTKFGEAPAGIYSFKTMKTYLDEAVKFGKWTKEKHGSRTMEQAKEYVVEYLERGKERNLSAWTLKLQRSALRKTFQDPELAENVQLPNRKKENIVRSRGTAVRDKDFSETRNRNLVDFAKGTGLRREGMSKVRPQDIFERDGKLFVAIKEKGGRYREAPVLQQYQERIREIAATTREPDEKIFEKVHSSADIHGYRREYAQNLYKEITGSHYDSASKDKKALLQVSEALGHGRLDVVTRNYL